MKQLVISAGGVRLEAELNASEPAGKIWEALPITAVVKRWAKEICFEIAAAIRKATDSRSDVKVGEPVRSWAGLT